MERARRRHGQPAEQLLWLIAGCAIVLGIVLRFTNLGAPLFWQDEAYTALRTTGHSAADYDRLFDGRVHTVAEIRAFETVVPDRGVAEVAALLAHEDSHHAPLFYMLERAWIGVSGTSAAGFRSLPALLGTLGILLAFALGRSVMRSTRAGMICATLVALSPIFVLYSRQAREYALFADVTMLATTVFLAAVRRSSPARWAAYAATVVMGFYTDPIFLLVALAHTIAAVALGPGRAMPMRNTAAALAVGLGAFGPWALNAAHRGANIGEQMDWARTAYPPRFLAMKWVFNLGALAFDGEFARLWLAPLAGFVLVALAIALAVAIRRAPNTFWAITAPLGLVTLVVFVGRDVLGGSHYETIPRYLTPFWLACMLVLACAIDIGLAQARTRAVAAAGGVTLLALGLTAALLRGAAPNWWDNNDQIAFQSMAARINRDAHPLVITQAHWHVPLVLARYLRDDAQFLLFTGTPPLIPAGRSAFLIAPTTDVLRAVTAATAGRYAIVNVSPAPPSVIASFHRGLNSAAPALERGNAPAFAPGNALYALTASASRNAQALAARRQRQGTLH